MSKILFVGDIMPGGCFPYMEAPLTPELRSHIYGHHIVVGTLEAAIGNGYNFDPVKQRGRNNIIYALNEDVSLLESINVDVVSLANTHVYDLDYRGLMNTIEKCKDCLIRTCGAGSNLEEARKPAVVNYDGDTFAFLGYCCCGNESMGYVRYATKTEAGVSPLVLDYVIEDIKKCKEKYDHVIVLPHWGEEYEYLPFVEDVEMARAMIDAGADAVMGSHTHRIGPMIEYKGKPIYFSMGNFMFPDYYMKPPRPIFYPSEEERNGIKRAFGYPFPIYEKQMQIWEGMSRVGMIVSYDSETGSSSYKLTSLSQENTVGFFNRWSKPLKRLRMKIMGECIKSKNYGIIFRWYYGRGRKIRRAWHRAVAVLGINFDEKIML